MYKTILQPIHEKSVKIPLTVELDSEYTLEFNY